MRLFFRRAGIALIAVLGVACVGCQEDNEAAIKQQEAKSSEAQAKNATPQPKSLEDMAAQQANVKKGSSGYPGVKKK